MPSTPTSAIWSSDARPGPAGLLVTVGGALVLGAGVLGWLAIGWSWWNGPAVLVGIAMATLPTQRARRHALERRFRAVLEPWAASRGLAFVGGMANPGTTPTLARRGTLSAAMRGPVGGDPDGALAHYVYTIRVGKSSYPVWLTVAIARVPTGDDLRLRIVREEQQQGLGGLGLFDDWHAHETVSAEVDDAYAIELGEGHDPLRIAELLDPVALRDLVDAGDAIIEIDHGTLLLAYGGRLGLDDGDLALLDELRALAGVWGARVAGVAT